MNSNGRHEDYGVTYAVESSSLSSFSICTYHEPESKKPPMELELVRCLPLDHPKPRQSGDGDAQGVSKFS